MGMRKLVDRFSFLSDKLCFCCGVYNAGFSFPFKRRVVLVEFSV
ncbi:MAG: hypothetical protein HCTETUND1_141 [Candidatus Hodgkinia cicadicola]|nr:MAG: hypothetical protein HCTETUND1_141 [Candidatus Hodgkinia cicadicola]